MEINKKISLAEARELFFEHSDGSFFHKRGQKNRILSCVWGGFAFFAFMMAFKHAILCGRYQGSEMFLDGRMDGFIKKAYEDAGYTVTD